MKYEGEFLGYKKWSGKGYNINGDLLYEIINGIGKIKEYDYDSQLIFENEYKKGKIWNGKGKEYDRHGELIFEGEYKNGERNGEGKEYIINVV